MLIHLLEYLPVCIKTCVCLCFLLNLCFKIFLFVKLSLSILFRFSLYHWPLIFVPLKVLSVKRGTCCSKSTFSTTNTWPLWKKKCEIAVQIRVQNFSGLLLQLHRQFTVQKRKSRDLVWGYITAVFWREHNSHLNALQRRSAR